MPIEVREQRTPEVLRKEAARLLSAPPFAGFRARDTQLGIWPGGQPRKRNRLFAVAAHAELVAVDPVERPLYRGEFLCVLAPQGFGHVTRLHGVEPGESSDRIVGRNRRALQRPVQHLAEL